MRRVYGLSLYDLPVTEAAALAVNMPSGALIWQKLNTPKAWTTYEYLLAIQIDQMNMWMWGNADPKKRGPRPNPVPRPGQDSTSQNKQQASDDDREHRTRTIKPQAMTLEELDRFMHREFRDIKTRELRPQTE